MADLPKELKSYLIAHLRRIGYRNVHRTSAFQKAHIGRAKWECQQCLKIYNSSKDLHGDHLSPVVEPEKGFIDWNTYIERLFLGEIQAICKECHLAKSLEENKTRRAAKQNEWENVD